jgi:Fur family ferric uptake transcriptional regulator
MGDALKEARTVFTDFLSKRDLRMTPQRGLILDVFLKTESHLTSEDLFNLVRRRDKSIGQATVYRTLKLLSESGIAIEVDFGDGVARFEHKYGHDHHDHLICELCKKSIEVVDNQIEALQEKLACRHDFLLKGHKLYLFGICKECRNKGR